MDNPVLTSLCERRSIRAFKQEQVSDDQLKAVLVAGTYAPTGMNHQDPWIVAVQNASILDRLRKMNAAVMGSDSDPYYGAPTIVLVFGSPLEKWPNSVADGALVLGNMMNAAHAVGLASCWINREREMFATDEGRQLMKEMGLPDGLAGIGALALGYAAVPLPKARPRKENYYRVIK